MSDFIKCSVVNCEQEPLWKNHNGAKCFDHGGLNQIFTRFLGEFKKRSWNNESLSINEPDLKKRRIQKTFLPQDESPTLKDLQNIFVKQQALCEYCKTPFLLSKGLWELNAPSIDRKDSNRSYYTDNIVFACLFCQFGKGASDENLFRKILFYLFSCQNENDHYSLFIPEHDIEKESSTSNENMTPHKKISAFHRKFEINKKHPNEILPLKLNLPMIKPLPYIDHITAQLDNQILNETNCGNIITNHLPAKFISNWFNILKNRPDYSFSDATIYMIIYKQNFCCAVTGIPFCLCDVPACPLSPSFDRIDCSIRDYSILSNCHIVLLFCNLAKGLHSIMNFLIALSQRITSEQQFSLKDDIAENPRLNFDSAIYDNFDSKKPQTKNKIRLNYYHIKYHPNYTKYIYSGSNSQIYGVQHSFVPPLAPIFMKEFWIKFKELHFQNEENTQKPYTMEKIISSFNLKDQ